MSDVLAELVTLLGLERLEDSLFRGQSQDLGWGTVFGGQVLGQALSAAAQTVPSDRPVHSFNAYFLRPGDVSRPIIYDVDRIRDGGTFTTRRVVAIQHGHAIFNLAASFQVEEQGFTHHDVMPDVPPPESLETEQVRAARFIDSLPAGVRAIATGARAFEMRPLDPPAHPIDPPRSAPKRMLWLKATGTLPDDQALHRYLLAYASDYSLVTTALKPHGVGWLKPGLQIASLDHVMYFHQPLRVDEWLLYVMESPAAQGGRGLAHGRFFSRDGRLVASTIQEGLMRMRRDR